METAGNLIIFEKQKFVGVQDKIAMYESKRESK